MKSLRCLKWFLLLTCLMFGRVAVADHIAILYCAVDDKNEIRVVAADANPTGEIWAGGRKGQFCSQALHEVMREGYEVVHTDVPSIAFYGVTRAETADGSPRPSGQRPVVSERGYIVFVLKKVAPHQ